MAALGGLPKFAGNPSDFWIAPISVTGVPQSTSRKRTKPTVRSLAFELPRTNVGRHQYDERARRFVVARILAGDVIGEGRLSPGLARAIGAEARSPGPRPYSTREHVNEHVSMCRRAMQNR